MNQYRKIMILDANEDIKSKLEDAFKRWGHEQIQLLYTDDIEKVKAAELDCLIFSANAVKDMETFIAELKNCSIPKMIFVTDALNHPSAHTAAIHGISVHYREAGVTSLIYKIFDTFHPNKWIPDTVSFDQAKQEKNNSCSIIAVHSPKGGTGKTVTSINLAVQYARKGLKVLLVDTSLFGNIGIYLKIVHRGTGLSGILSALEQAEENMELPDMKELMKEKIHQYTNEDVKMDVLIAASPLKMEKMGANEVEIIVNILREMDYDVVILDTSSELSKKNLGILEMANYILFMISPDLGSGWNMIQYKEILKSVGIQNKFGFAVNNFSKHVGFSPKEMEAELGMPLWCIVPECKELQLMHNQGQPMALQEKHWMNPLYKRIAHYMIPIFTKKEMKLEKGISFQSLFSSLRMAPSKSKKLRTKRLTEEAKTRNEY